MLKKTAVIKFTIFILSIIYTQGIFSMNWTEFSFQLKPSPVGGIGVFATHDIPSGTLLFNNPEGHKIRILKIKDVPQEFSQYCVYVNDDECWAPERFDRMEMGWYINHSHTPNIASKKDVKKNDMNVIKPNLYAIKDIKAGDEILMDYNELNEPEHLKEDFYKNC